MKKLHNIDDDVLEFQLSDLSKQAGFKTLQDFLKDNWSLTLKEAYKKLLSLIPLEK